jgi:hypothetical protein
MNLLTKWGSILVGFGVVFLLLGFLTDFSPLTQPLQHPGQPNPPPVQILTYLSEPLYSSGTMFLAIGLSLFAVSYIMGYWHRRTAIH